jgi:hypothetical protein
MDSLGLIGTLDVEEKARANIHVEKEFLEFPMPTLFRKIIP